MKKWLIVATGVLPILFGLIWLGGRDRINAYRQELALAEQRAEADAENQEFQRKVMALKAEKGDRLRVEDVWNLLPEQTRAYYQAGFGNLDEIRFHGKVVDQHGNSISGARFDVDVAGKFLAGGGKLRPVSGQDGGISIKTEGGAFFSVGKIMHPRCYWVSPARINRGQIIPLDFYGYQPSDVSKELLWSEYDKENPYVFRMWCADDLKNVLHGRVQAGLANGAETRPLTIDFRRSGYDQNPRVLEGEVSGQLRVRIFSEPFPQVSDEHLQDAIMTDRDWWIEISAVDGGLVEVPEDDIYMNEAPEAGYQSMVRFSGRHNVRTVSEEQYERHFYFTSNSGSEYGVIVAQLYPLATRRRFGGSGVNIRFKMNASGSRNLVVMNWKPTLSNL